MYDFLVKLINQPIPVLIRATEALFDYKEGIIDTESEDFCPSDKQLLVNHAVLAVGFKINY